MKDDLRAHTTDWDVPFLDLPQTCMTLVESHSNIQLLSCKTQMLMLPS